jgi:thiol-disulfide isomerase/thioredoxin
MTRQIVMTIAFLPMMAIVNKTTGQQLNVGDQLPSLRFENVLNYRDGTLQTDDLKGKVVIFDFWNVFCGSCIAAMPKMEALQEEFKDQIQIILVTNDSKEKVEKLADRLPVVRDSKLVSIVGDTLLTKLFEYRTVPSHAWIDQQGVVKYFTSGENTSEQNIRKFLAGIDVNLLYKKEYRDYDMYESLLTEGGGRQMKHVQFYSLISKKIDDDGEGIIPIRHDGSTSFLPWQRKYVNMSIIDLYKAAYQKELHYTDGLRIPDLLIDVDVANKEDFYLPEEEDQKANWKQNNLFCYEICVPEKNANDRSEIMKRDLDMYFGLQAEIGDKKFPCIVLKKIEERIPFKSTSRERKVKRSKGYFLAQDQWFSLILDELNYYITLDPSKIFINETGEKISSRLDMELKGDLADLKVLNRELKKYNLQLISEKRVLKSLTLAEREK